MLSDFEKSVGEFMKTRPTDEQVRKYRQEVGVEKLDEAVATILRECQCTRAGREANYARDMADSRTDQERDDIEAEYKGWRAGAVRFSKGVEAFIAQINKIRRMEYAEECDRRRVEAAAKKIAFVPPDPGIGGDPLPSRRELVAMITDANKASNELALKICEKLDVLTAEVRLLKPPLMFNQNGRLCVESEHAL